MKYFLYFIFISSILMNCTGQKKEVPTDTASSITMNVSNNMLSGMEWLNQPKSFEIVDSSLSVTVTKGTDFFNSPEDNSVIGSAPYLYQWMNGDFMVKTLIQPDFNAQWNAVALMVHIDSLHWIKLAFENSDATGPGIVTVVTRRTSDDSNGVILNEQSQIWLALARKNNIYSMHWSKDGKNFKMARLTNMPEANSVKIGIEFQSPVGEEATHMMHYFKVEEKTIENLRDLN